MLQMIIPSKHVLSQVVHLEVTLRHAGQRIDNFLFCHFKNIPKPAIYRLIRRGEVRLNSKRIKPYQRLNTGDNIRVPPITDIQQYDSLNNQLILPSPKLQRIIQDSIIYEDSELLVINKPAGLAVHGGSGLNFSIIGVLRALRPEEPCLELVHRLDRDTSGCLLLAKTPDILRSVQYALKNRLVVKKYLLLVRGHWRHGLYNIDLPLQRNKLSVSKRMVKVTNTGKSAYTLFKPLTFFREASLLEASITTGRTHQIRVHAAHVNYPIAGDKKYGNDEFNQLLSLKYGLTRLFLHAYSLQVPLKKKDLIISAPLPTTLASILSQLKNLNSC